ncbi:MAG: MBL fold metallo-hydrolase [Petrimonas sp.]|nr:MBL fold metallo-hydrolase [Petrimonas sp.]MEA5063200.1 MBL fold metallo-hydrolase [Petrimonas sp.]
MRKIVGIVICAFFLSCQFNDTEIGKSYSGWKEGEMDIHHIYTGRGESNFFIFPDGTTMLIDAGDWDPQDYGKMCELLPDSSRRSGEWIARYIKRVNPFKDKVDYLMISHFHNDHIGDCTNNAIHTTGRNPDYLLTGIAEVGEYIQFKKVIDRGWPDYQYPLLIQDPDFMNYLSFIQWKMQNDGLEAEKLKVGSKKQIILLKEKEKYERTFEIRNLAVNGRIWTGKGNETTDYYDLHPENRISWQNENTKSIGIRISYGIFSYYTAGDISGFLLDEQGNVVDMEEKIAQICGPVDVCKVNHHAYRDAMTKGFIENIKASAYIIPVWDYEHIQPEVLERMASRSLYPACRMVFPTRFPEKLRSKYEKEPWINAVCPEDGHVVVKVFDNGDKYKIYILSAHDEKLIVKNVYGPYSSKLPDSY